MKPEPSAVAVRPVARADFDAWKPLWDGYNAFYGRHGDSALAEAVTRATWERFFDPAEPVHALVADVSGRLLGLAHYLFHRSTIQIAPTCYLQDLFTHEQARGQGVGRSLIEAVAVHAKAADAGRVYWHTQATNTVARRLYDAVGQDSGFIVYRKPL
ncbi:GNAT family N-acetyltransferase [Piscinibacter sp. XHJ-5]|uniref:GNAT family N-acetyltransferase n=1 Tax=Piscinibacter sp. XHJ-5 TaxID=3037797 RepID=UPI002453713C|nr:GNAT family N-acetyltransferase [Piscinibacter sp. XHJ-5]